MHRKWLTVGLPLIALAACGAGVLVQTGTEHCALATWLCNREGMLRDLAMMMVPLVLLTLLGMVAGIRQFRQTRIVVRALLRLPRRPMPSHLAALVRQLDLDGRVDLVAYPAPKAFCFGFFRPRICLTDALVAALTASEVEAVLRHERHHLRHYDPLRALLWTTLVGALWWLEPHAQHAEILRELAADRAVLQAQGRRPLASALLKLLSAPHAEPGGHPDVAISGLSETDARLAQLLHPEQVLGPTLRLWHWLLLPALVLVTLLLCSVVMAHYWA